MAIRIFQFLVCFLLFHGSVAQQVIHGRVIKVVDGDTFDLLTNAGKSERIRMSAIDAPEKRQDFGMVSRRFLAQQIEGKTVKVIWGKRDRNGRILGTVFLNQQEVNYLMIRMGMAWHFVRYSRSPRYAKAQKLAKGERIGLWHDGLARPPWEFRRINQQKTR